MNTASGSAVLSRILGKIEEVCIVSPDVKKTIDGLSRLGIGPFQIFDFNDQTVHDRRWRGGPGEFTLGVAFAKQNDLVFEIMQPTGGQSLMAEYLERHGGQEGIQHVAFDMKGIPMAERQKQMKDRGISPAMEGSWQGKKGTCRFCFFDTESLTGTVFETIEFSEDWEDPLFEWYPHPPQVSDSNSVV